MFGTLFDCAVSSQSDDIFIAIIKAKVPMPAASHQFYPSSAGYATPLVSNNMAMDLL